MAKRRRSIEELKQIRDSWDQEHSRAILETNAALKHERSSLKRFQQADDEYKAALKKA